jgi:hypothetical protein
VCCAADGVALCRWVWCRAARSTSPASSSSSSSKLSRAHRGRVQNEGPGPHLHHLVDGDRAHLSAPSPPCTGSPKHLISQRQYSVLVTVVLFGLGGFAAAAHSEAVLPAYLIGLVVAGVFRDDRIIVDRLRIIAFAL